jgi:hypothetical protein
MMEKIEGVRVFWDGKHLHYPRAKIKINVPSEYNFPSTPFEGQLS